MRVNPFPKLKPSQEAEGLELLRSTPTLYKLWAWGPGRGRDLPTITADGPLGGAACIWQPARPARRKVDLMDDPRLSEK